MTSVSAGALFATQSPGGYRSEMETELDGCTCYREWGTPLYNLYSYVRPSALNSVSRLITGIDLQAWSPGSGLKMGREIVFFWSANE